MASAPKLEETDKINRLNDQGQRFARRVYKDGNTEFLLAAQRSFMKYMQALLDYGANLLHINNRGDNALNIAANCGHTDVVRFLVYKGMDVICVNQEGNTALHLAAKKGHFDLTKLLLEYQTDNKSVNKHGRNALHLVAFYGHQDIAELLLQKIAIDIASVTQNGRDALHLAALRGHRKVVDLLLRHGADKTRVDVSGRNALHLASFHGHRDVVDCLIRYNMDIHSLDNDECNALHLASWQGNCSVVEQLLKEAIDTTLLNKYGENALHLATKNGHEDIVKLLASLDIYFPPDHILHKPKTQTEPKKKLKLQKLFRITYLDFKSGSSGKTALHYAAEKGFKNIVKILIQAGASVHIEDEHGEIAEDMAERNHHQEIVNILEESRTKGKSKASSLSSSLKSIRASLSSSGKSTTSLLESLDTEDKEIYCPVYFDDEQNAATNDVPRRFQQRMRTSSETDVGHSLSSYSKTTSGAEGGRRPSQSRTLTPNLRRSRSLRSTPRPKRKSARPRSFRSPQSRGRIGTNTLRKKLEALLTQYDHQLISYGSLPDRRIQPIVIVESVHKHGYYIRGENVVVRGKMTVQDSGENSPDTEDDSSGES